MGGVHAASASLKLTSGTYAVTETKAPTGYKAAAPQKFTVSDNGSVLVKGKTQQDRTVTLTSQKLVKTSGHTGHAATHHGRTGHTARPAKTSAAKAKTGKHSGHHANVKRGAEGTEGTAEEGKSDEPSGNVDDTSHTILIGAAGVTGAGVQPMAANASAITTSVTQNSGSDASSHMHAKITTNNDTYESGTTAIVSVKYTLDRGAVHKGDYVIVTIPTDIASKVSLSLNSQHFSGFEDLRNGQYKLTFAKDIESGLSGSFSAFVTTSTVDNKTTQRIISAGDARKDITVVPGGSPGGSGTYTDTIMKDAAENAGVSYGGYDYSDGIGDRAAQIGVADLTKGGTYKYRLFINEKKGSISNVTVVDRLPDGMTLNKDKDKGFKVLDQETQQQIDSSNYSITQSGQTLIIKIPGEFSNTIQVNYWVDIPKGSNTSKYTNTATITYTQDGDVHQEHRNYVLQGSENNASNGEKSVDKSIITTDPDDQFVTYTIKFWNSNGFAQNTINLVDKLDSHVRFVSADPNDYFSVDSTDLQNIKITNNKEIPSSLTTYVRFMVDMTNVPIGYTVYNTVGGNTTKTTKYDGGLKLNASKKLNDKNDGITAGQFRFQLLSANDSVLQTKTNAAGGSISFDRIAYTIDDVGKTYIYKVQEIAGNDDKYTYDSSVYIITVTPELEKDSSGNPTGKILAEPTITKDNNTVDAITFNNTTKSQEQPVEEEGSLKLTKTSKGHDTPADAEFTITGPNNYSKTVKYSDLADGSITLSNLPIGTYTVTESKADIDGYSLNVTGDRNAEVTKDGTAELKLTNAYTPNTPVTPITPTPSTPKTSVKVTKNWVGGQESSAVIHLLADGNVIKTETLNAQNGWTYTFSNLDKESAGHDIQYTVTEDKVDGYTTSITGDMQNGFVITNTKDQPDKPVKPDKPDTPDTPTPSMPENHSGNNTPSHSKNTGNHSGQNTPVNPSSSTVDNHQTVKPMTPAAAKTAVSGNHAAASANIPKTGDETDLSLYAFLLGGAAALLAVILVLKSRREN